MRLALSFSNSTQVVCMDSMRVAPVNATTICGRDKASAIRPEDRRFIC